MRFRARIERVRRLPSGPVLVPSVSRFGSADPRRSEVAPPPTGGGVIALYPGKTAHHAGEVQNAAEVGVHPFDLMMKRRTPPDAASARST